MGKQYRFIGAYGEEYLVSEIAVLIVIALHNLKHPNNAYRVQAIRAFRTFHPFGLKDSKDICDYIAEYGRLDGQGHPTIDKVRPPTMSYVGYC